MIYSLFVMNLINSYVIFDFMNQMYPKKYKNEKIYILGFIVFISLHLFVNSFRIAAVNVIYEILNIYLFGIFLYNDIPNKTLYGIVFALYLIFMDTISFPICAIFVSQSLDALLMESQYAFISGIINYIIVICTYKLIINYFFKRNINIISIRQDIFFIILAFSEIVMILYIWKIEMKSTAVIFFTVSISFLCLDLYILYLFEFVSKHNELKNKICLAEQQALMLNRSIHDIERKYQKSQKVIHDVRNYLQVLQKLRDNQAENLTNKYTKQLSEKLNELEYRFQSNNPIMRILINDTLLLAEEKDIELKLKVKDIDWSFLAEIDLTTLFANLFNNAIEACEDCCAGKRWIDFRIGQANQHAVIFISNPYQEHNLILQQEKFISTKNGHSGIGLSNIRNVIEKYNGNIIIDTNDNIFTVKIIIPQEKK